MREEEGEGRRARQGEEVKEGQGGGREGEMRKGGKGEIIMPTCPEFTKRTEHLLRLVIEREHWQPSLASELAASSNGRHIRSGWDIEMPAVGITQLVVVVVVGEGGEGKGEEGG